MPKRQLYNGGVKATFDIFNPMTTSYIASGLFDIATNHESASIVFSTFGDS